MSKECLGQSEWPHLHYPQKDRAYQMREITSLSSVGAALELICALFVDYLPYILPYAVKTWW